MRRVEYRTEEAERGAFAHAPFVEVADQQRRTAGAVRRRLQKRFRLARPGMTQQTQVGGDYPQRTRLQVEIDDEGAARLDARQFQLPYVGNRTLTDKQDVAMPSVALLAERRNGNGDKMRLTAQVLEIEEPRALAESLVGLLKRDDIRTDL